MDNFRLVKQKYIRKLANGCWEGQSWLKTGYCLIIWHNRQVPLHRVVYEELKGPIPEGLVLDHLCRYKRCCNPEHLEPVQQIENVHRGKVIKLSTTEVANIRQLYKAGNITQTALAVQFKCSLKHICFIINNKCRNLK